MLIFVFMLSLLLQVIPSPFDLPMVVGLGTALIGPTKVTVDILRGSFPRLPDAVWPISGLLAAFGIALVIQIAMRAHFDGSLYAQCFLAAIGGQAGAMLATLAQKKADQKRLDAQISDRLQEPQG